jgi:hypothetical protein
LSPKERKRILYETISKHENIGSNELFGKVISENGNVFSKPTYFKYLKELENEHKISVIREEGRQDFIITTVTDAPEIMKLFAKGFDFTYTRLEDYLNILKKNVRRMSDDEKVEYLASLVRLIQYKDWLLSCYTIKTASYPDLIYRCDRMDVEPQLRCFCLWVSSS